MHFSAEIWCTFHLLFTAEELIREFYGDSPSFESIRGQVIRQGKKILKEEIELKHGAIVVATGAKELKTNQYLYGEDERIVTQLDLESILHRITATHPATIRPFIISGTNALNHHYSMERGNLRIGLG